MLVNCWRAGAALIQTNPADAIKVLQQALRLDPEIPELRYQLGLAFHAIGDEADAESEFHEAISRTPESAPAHNYLGIALFQVGDAKAALDEFRTAARLAPQDANAHFNLGEALARTGDSRNAVEELRMAAGLSPSDAGLARLMKVVETALATPDSTIKVDVRQVLVPVVVTDKEGHHVTGLTQGNFKVFEDGVEQKITAFSVEKSGLPDAETTVKDEAKRTSAKPPAASDSRGAAPAQPPVRRTYFVIIDTLHLSFANFVSAREALVKLFKQEHGEDSQYVVIALGTSAEIVHNVTRDPAAVLAVLENKKFQKVFLDGQLGGLQAEMERYRYELNETRKVCDAIGGDGTVTGGGDPLQIVQCQIGIERAPQRAEAIGELDRTLTIGFLRQFRSLVAQLARGRDRRTMILLSNGFQIMPGQEAFSLLNAFFPQGSHCLVPPSIPCRFDGIQSMGRLADEFEPILQMAARNNITIDTIDSRGLYGPGAYDASNPGATGTVAASIDRTDRDIASANGNTLRELAEATGGTAFHDSNNLLGGLQRAFADGRDYYTIAYVSSNAARDGKFRAISVQVGGRSVVVSAKKGYWSEPAPQ